MLDLKGLWKSVLEDDPLFKPLLLKRRRVQHRERVNQAWLSVLLLLESTCFVAASTHGETCYCF